jgi:hypothetical protein
MKKVDLSHLMEHHKSSIVPRSQIEQFTGGSISYGYMKNLDSKGLGCKRFRLGNKVVYKTEDLIKWLESRSKIVE